MTDGAATAVVDAHAHVWRAVPDYPDPTLTIVSPVSDIPVAILDEYMEEYRVDRAVLVQPICTGTDNSYVAEQAASRPDRLAAVCVVDPLAADVEEELRRWSAAGCRGVRLRLREPDGPAALRPEAGATFWESARRLELVVSVYTDVGALPAIREVAAAFPDVPIVVDHYALPDPGRKTWPDLLALADAPRIYVKVSGYHHFSAGAYPYADAWPLFRAVREAFGSDRLLWGSDFPHVLLRCGYGRSRALQERSFDFLDERELGAIMGGTASALYWPAAA